ncbi:MAG: glycosyltransferase family 2 protein [Leeuwenhoekiella sp.]
MVSILIPVFNYNVVDLVELLNSMGIESDIPFEIIIADDASTDLASAKINSDLDYLTNVTYYDWKENKGRAATRDFLARKATFDTLLFLDADVMPQAKEFLSKFIDRINDADVIFGGVAYSIEKPKKNNLLRWTYGKNRETRTVTQRCSTPYLSVISGAICIKKEVFIKANSYLDSGYGLDVLFVYNLQQAKAKVLHIDNPVLHLGLENSEIYINKTKSGLKTLARLQHTKKIPLNYRPIQKVALKLQKLNLASGFISLFSKVEDRTIKNLLSSKPSLKLFDAYRLYYFLKILQADA